MIKGRNKQKIYIFYEKKTSSHTPYVHKKCDNSHKKICCEWEVERERERKRTINKKEEEGKANV